MRDSTSLEQARSLRQRLIDGLKILAMDGETALSSLPSFVDPGDELASEVADPLEMLEQFTNLNVLSEQQFMDLRRLVYRFDEHSKTIGREFWSTHAIRASAEWQGIRDEARRILQVNNW